MTIVTQNCQGMFLNLVVIIMAFLNLLIFILNDGYIMYGDHIFEITGEEFKILDDTGLPTENTLFYLFCHFSFIYDSRKVINFLIVTFVYNPVFRLFKVSCQHLNIYLLSGPSAILNPFFSWFLFYLRVPFNIVA